MSLPRVATRCATLMAVAGLVAALVWGLAGDTTLALARRLPDGPVALGTLPFVAALTGVCSLALVGCTGWLVGMISLVAVEALVGAITRSIPARAPAPLVVAGWTSRRLSAWLCPSAVRRLALTGCGVALATGLAGAPALADATGTAAPSAAGSGARVSGLGLPDRTVGTAAPLVHTVVVSSGDSLWSLAERALPEDAANAEITKAWHTIHRTNRDRIGNDPDLIFPGTPLQIPDLDRTHRKDSP